MLPGVHRGCGVERGVAEVAGDPAAPAVEHLVGAVERRGIDPVDRAGLVRAAQGDVERDPADPGRERAVTAPCGQRAVGGHERLLGGIFGRVAIAKHPVADAGDGRQVALDQHRIRVAVAGEDIGDDAPGRLIALDEGGRVGGGGGERGNGGCPPGDVRPACGRDGEPERHGRPRGADRLRVVRPRSLAGGA